MPLNCPRCLPLILQWPSVRHPSRFSIGKPVLMELLQFVLRGRCESIEPYYDAKPGQPIKAMFTISSRVYHWHSTIARGTLTDECGSSLTRDSSTVYHTQTGGMHWTMWNCIAICYIMNNQRKAIYLFPLLVSSSLRRECPEQMRDVLIHHKCNASPWEYSYQIRS